MQLVIRVTASELRYIYPDYDLFKYIVEESLLAVTEDIKRRLYKYVLPTKDQTYSEGVLYFKNEILQALRYVLGNTSVLTFELKLLRIVNDLDVECVFNYDMEPHHHATMTLW
jgi:hypothetical protein